MELAWGVLDKYYSKTDEVVYYAAALILHPARHTEYIKNNWPKKRSGPTLTKVKQLWAAYRYVSQRKGTRIHNILGP